jgi:hypothetical protein
VGWTGSTQDRRLRRAEPTKRLLKEVELVFIQYNALVEKNNSMALSFGKEKGPNGLSIEGHETTLESKV